MKMSNVPGYKDLFPEGNEHYEDLIKGLAPEMIIRICSAINNELNGAGGMAGTQGSILQDFAQTFTVNERKELQARMAKYREKVGNDVSIIVFATRYLVTMVLKALNDGERAIEMPSGPAEYRLFKAYLLVVDEVAAKDHLAIDFKALPPNDTMNLLRLLWLPMVSQFEFNEHSNLLFETYKCLCLFKYLQGSCYRVFLKEYLHTLNFRSVSRYLGSFKQINRTIQNIDLNAKMLRRLNYIVPEPGVDQTHLKRLSVNLRQQPKYTLTDLKKAPLVYAEDRQGYMVIDYNYSHKKMFLGAYFETCHETSLTNSEGLSRKEKQTIFNTYSTDAANAFEKHYFKPVMELLASAHCDVCHFDDGSPNIPDAYIRIGQNVLLFEFKAYVFREDLAASPNFDRMISYIEERFVSSDNHKPKGVAQLINQIDLFHKAEFTFDPMANNLITQQELHFYPIIVYMDFNFSLPGVNTYLNQRMWELLAEKPSIINSVKPLVMLNLETIMDIAVSGARAPELGNLIWMYYNFLEQVRAGLEQAPSTTNIARAHSSFDEFYRAYIEKPHISDDDRRNQLHRLLELAGIDFDEFQKEI